MNVPRQFLKFQPEKPGPFTQLMLQQKRGGTKLVDDPKKVITDPLAQKITPSINLDKSQVAGGIDSDLNQQIIQLRKGLDTGTPKVDEFAIDPNIDKSVEDTSGVDKSSSPLFQDPTADIAKIAGQKETDIASAPDEDLDYTDTYTEEELKAVTDPEVKKKAAQAQLFTDAMKDIEDRFGDDPEPKKRKTIDDYKKDFEFRYIDRPRHPVSTGWIEMDKITKGGLGKGELGVGIAATGAGKSMALVHLGAAALKAGKNVVHYTLELTEPV